MFAGICCLLATFCANCVLQKKISTRLFWDDLKSLTPMHLQTLTNMFPCGGIILYKNFPPTKTKMEVAINIAGTPKAKEKQSFSPKQCCSLKIGVTVVEIREPALIAK